ncbi:MAG: histidine kinase, gyrase and HSP90-like ATPase family protein [Gemmatimonadetes bacterium]|nr:histidine kinase, gyrase and HSP90-like ATPase family protein [Gemmatimonadota bacterium]
MGTSSGTRSPASHSFSRGAAALVGAWLALSLVRLLARLVAFSISARSAGDLARMILLVTAFWMLATPVVLMLERRVAHWPVRSAGRWGAHALHLAVLMLVEPWWFRQVLLWAGGTPAGYWVAMVSRADTNALLYALVLIVDQLRLRYRDAQARSDEAARLQSVVADAELNTLTLQLQPHFLFNAMQLIAEAGHSDVDGARKTLSDLRGLLAWSSGLEKRREVSLHEELDFLCAFAAIQERRFGRRLTVSVLASSEAMTMLVPPLLLQPLVENAIRHGIAPRARGGIVTVKAFCVEGRLLMTVTDDGVGLRGRDQATGLGISVTRKRLFHAYGEDHSFGLGPADGVGTTARVDIPARRALEHGAVDLTAGAFGDDDAQADHQESPSAERGHAHPLAQGFRIAAGWALVLLLLMPVEMFAADPTRGAFVQNMVEELAGIPFWLLLTVAALVAGNRARHTRITYAVDALVALGLLALHARAGPMMLGLLGRPMEATLTYAMWIPWDLSAYGIVLAATRADAMAAWARSHLDRAARLREQWQHVRGRLQRLRMQQPLLLNALDSVARAQTVAAWDRAAVSCAEFFRALLAAGESAELTLGQELSLAESYASLCLAHDVDGEGCVTEVDEMLLESRVATGCVTVMVDTLLRSLDSTPRRLTLQVAEGGDALAIRVTALLPDGVATVKAPLHSLAPAAGRAPHARLFSFLPHS